MAALHKQFDLRGADDEQLVAAAECAISDALQAVGRQRAQSESESVSEDVALRLFPTKSGDFIRVLDRHDAPLSPGMLDAIHTFFASEQELAASSPEAHLDVSSEQREPLRACSQESALDAFIASADAVIGATTLQPAGLEHTACTECVAVTAAEASSDALAIDRTEKPDALTESSPAVDRRDAVNGYDPATSPAVDNQKPADAAQLPLESVRPVDEVVAHGELMSLLFGSELENGEDEDAAQAQTLARASSSSPTDAVITSATHAAATRQVIEDFTSLCECWPAELVARRTVRYVPSRATATGTTTAAAPPCVLYWMRHTLRVTHGNFALEAARLLAQRLSVALVTLSLVPNAVVYPTCHAASASDAFARWSFADVHSQLQQLGLPFVGVTASTAPRKLAAPSASGEPHHGAYPLFQLLDAFVPHVVVTDDSWDFVASRELDQLVQLLHATPGSSSWPLVAVDSNTCVPIQSRLAIVQRTLVPGERFVREDAFSSAYTESYQPHGEPLVATQIGQRASRGVAVRPKREAFAQLLRELELEEVDWRIVEALNAQSSPEMAPFSEMDALQKLDRLLAESSDRPAIQAELQGEGVLSLLPYIRHGTLFAGHVIHEITSTIAVAAPCRTPQERKRLAMLKVMRSRALTHLGRDRDYALYLALWTSIQYRHRDNAAQHAHSALRFAKCFALEALSSFELPTSLDVHGVALPSWISSNSRFGAGSPVGDGAATYDPYELESARTDDLYWNDIQKFLLEHRYLHPLLVVYWSYRILQWSVSSKAAIATIESLLAKCALGATVSPDAVFAVWHQLFHLGKELPRASTSELSPHALQALMDEELASQPRLKLQP